MARPEIIPTWRDLEVYLQLLPRSSTAERMNPYTTLFTGVNNRMVPRPAARSSELLPPFAAA